MSQHTAHNNEEMIAELQKTEKALKSAEQLRMRAIANKGAYEQQLKDNDNDLRALGTTAEKAEAELQHIDSQVAEKLELINSMLPYDLMTKWKML